MTRLTRDVRRETAALVQGRPLMLVIGRHTITVRQKGKRFTYTVPIECLWPLGAKISRREQDEAKKKGKNAKANRP